MCRSVCGGVSQCVEVCQSVLKSVKFGDVHEMLYVFVLQYVADCCSMVNCVCCSVCYIGRHPQNIITLRIAGCCSVLRCDVVCCSLLQRVEICCSVLHCIALCRCCCSVLQCVAVCCSVQFIAVLQCVSMRSYFLNVHALYSIVLQ